MPTGTPYSLETRNRAIERVKNGEKKIDVSREMGINYYTLFSWTMHIPSCRLSYLRGRTLEIFKEIIAKGYYMGTIPPSAKHMLKAHFPIRQAHVSGKCIAYLPGKEEVALKAYLDRYRKKTVSFREVSLIARAFGLKRNRNKAIKEVLGLLILLPLLLLASGCTGDSLVETATVTRVIDGDTFVINGGERVRIIGIDTPEINEEHYAEAKAELEDMVLNKEVILVKDVSETDRYGRLLRYVEVDGLDVGYELVCSEYAKTAEYPPDTARAERYEACEGQ